MLVALFGYTPPEIKYFTDYINQESSFNYKRDNYKLITKGTLIHTDYGYDNDLTIQYDVYKNGILMESKNKINQILVDCDYTNGGPFENHYEIELIEDINAYGWIIYSGGICGNTFSYQAEIILPHLNETKSFSKLNKIFKSKPIIIKYQQYIDIFYDFQEWNCAGTACSIYVPQKLRYNIQHPYFIKSPIQISDFRKLKQIISFSAPLNYIGQYGFSAVFMAGLNDLNPVLMQYALDELYDSEDSCLDWFFGAENIWSPEDINYEMAFIRIHSTSRGRFQRIIDNLWDIKIILKALGE